MLVVIAMLSLAGYTFSELMLTERKATGVFGRQLQVRAAADSGVELVRSFLTLPPEDRDGAGGWYENPGMFQGKLLVDDAQARGRCRFAVIAAQFNQGLPDGYRFGLENESGRLNPNALIELRKSIPADLAPENYEREILMGLPGMDEYTADAILDWIDLDDEPREFGAESEYYLTLDPPYETKNGPLETVEELLLVRGVTPQLLFGPDANRNGIVDSDEAANTAFESIDNSDGSMDRGWSAYLTLYSLELNVRPDGRAKIDLNQEDMEQLYDELDEAFGGNPLTAHWPTFIVAYRQNGPYEPAGGGSGGGSDTGSDEGADAESNAGSDEGTAEGVVMATGELDLTQPGRFPLTTVLDLIDVSVRVRFEGDEENTVLAPAFPNMPMLMNGYMPMLLDQVAVNTSPVIGGQINVNQAPRVVLLGIPGMTPEIVDNIVSYRNSNPLDDDSLPHRRYATWLLGEAIVTVDEMKALWPLVTAGGDVYRAQVVGYYEEGGPVARIEAVIDATKQPASLVFWRDISHLGPGYAVEWLGVGGAE